MPVAAGGKRELVAQFDECARDLVAATLEAHAAAAAEDLAAETRDGDRARQERYLEQITGLRRQLEETSGPVVLSGSAPLVVEIVRGTAVQATYDLDCLVVDVAATLDRLSADAIAELRSRSQRTQACVEALIACESSRGRA